MATREAPWHVLPAWPLGPGDGRPGGRVRTAAGEVVPSPGGPRRPRQAPGGPGASAGGAGRPGTAVRNCVRIPEFRSDGEETRRGYLVFITKRHPGLAHRPRRACRTEG